jgi:hypothetical protein
MTLSAWLICLLMLGPGVVWILYMMSGLHHPFREEFERAQAERARADPWRGLWSDGERWGRKGG